MRTTAFAIWIAAIVLAGSAIVTVVPVAGALPTTPTWTYTLYGNSTNGWGFTLSTIAKPGPALFVTTGEILSLRLFSQDHQTHNWTIDLNNNSAANPGEPHSLDFSSATVPTWFNLTVTLSPGTYAYRCMIHPSNMFGYLVVQAAPTFTLWGSAATGKNGWGATSAVTTNPGPTLNVPVGQTVTVDLFSADGANHSFYVDFAKSGSPTGNTVSTVFNGTHSIRFTFVANTAGDFTYGCGIHGALMKGTLHVAAAPPPAGPDYTLYAAVIIVVVLAAVAAAILIRRRPRTPPPPK